MGRQIGEVDFALPAVLTSVTMRRLDGKLEALGWIAVGDVFEMRILGHISLVLMLLNAGTLPAWSDSGRDYKDCIQGTNAAAKVRGCSAIIDHSDTRTQMRARAYRARGDAYQDQQENDRAIEDYDQAIRLNPKDTDAYINRGWAYNDKGAIDRAMADFDQAIRLDPKNELAYAARGLANKGREDDRAIADFSQAIRLDPKYAAAYASRGEAYRSKGDNDRAIADYNQAIRLDPKYADTYAFRGEAYRSKGDNDRAIADYNLAIRLDPKDASAYAFRGGAYSSKGENDRAIADYDQAIRLDPKDADAYNLRGIAYFNKGEFDRAIADYDESIRLDRDATPYNNLGIVYQSKGDKDRAITNFEQASRIDPTSPSGIFGHGAALFVKGEIDRSIADFNEVIRLDAKLNDAFTERGLAHSAKGEHAQSIADFDEALRIDPFDPFSLGGRAAVFEKVGDFARARADLHKVLKIRPNDQVAKDALTRLAQIERGRATAQENSASEMRPAPVQKPATPAHSSAKFSRRVALVIGNGAYQAVPALPNPSNDAKAMAEMFSSAGFDSVDVAVNLGVKDMRRALRDFADKAADADAAVVYFAGHGVEIGGRDYLIPTDAVLRTDIDVEDEAVELDRVLQLLEPVKKLKLVILDACRDNPFRQSMRRTAASRSIGRGLAAPDLQTGDTLIAFAAKAGSEAADGMGVNSPFTSALLRSLTVPGLDIRIALGQVHDDVLRATGRTQEPYIYGALGGGTLALAPGN